VTDIKITFTEKTDGKIVQEKSYKFNKDQFKAFMNDRQRSAYINALVGKDWTNSDDVRKAKKEKREKKLIKNGEEPYINKSEEETKGGDAE
jgi:hypothetical protein